MTGRSFFLKMGGIIAILSSLIALLPRSIRESLFVFFRGTHGKKGILIRYLLFRKLVKSCGENVVIYEDAYILSLDQIECGDNVSIHEMSYIEAKGGLSIGNDVAIAHNASILTTNHAWDNPEVPIKYNPIKKRPVKICDDCWIGCGARIMPGITIGKRSVVAAGAVVTKDVSSHTIVAGLPAKLLKNII